MKRRGILSFCLLQSILWLRTLGGASAAETSPATTVYIERNGVRLVGGDATQGRVEARGERGDYWVRFCDQFFTDEQAQAMCNLLGYAYGDKNYYDLNLAFPKDSGGMYIANTLDCYENNGDYNGGRRRLHGAAAAEGSGAAAEHHLLMRGGASSRASSNGDDDASASDFAGLSIAEGTSAARRDGTRRRELAALAGYIDSADDAPWSCMFMLEPHRTRACSKAGNRVAAIRCSNTTLQPAKPLPPSPPNPPPEPPSPASLIRLLEPEPNLCTGPAAAELGCSPQRDSSYYWSSFNRVEMLVDEPRSKKSGSKVWAPVCNIPADGRNYDWLARTACTQWFADDPVVVYSEGAVATTPFQIPLSGAEPASGHFNRKVPKAWVTFPSQDYVYARSLSDLPYNVSTVPCESRALLAIACSPAVM